MLALTPAEQRKLLNLTIENNKLLKMRGSVSQWVDINEAEQITGLKARSIRDKANEGIFKEIINAVTGSKPKEIEIGQKVPAIDYASTITKIKSLKNNSYYIDLLRYHKILSEQIGQFVQSVEKASEIDL